MESSWSNLTTPVVVPLALANLALLRHDEIRQGQGLDLFTHPFGLSIMLVATGKFLSQWDMNLPKPVLCFFLPCLQFLFLLQSTVLPWLRLNLYFCLPFLLLLLNLSCSPHPRMSLKMQLADQNIVKSIASRTMER